MGWQGWWDRAGQGGRLRYAGVALAGDAVVEIVADGCTGLLGERPEDLIGLLDLVGCRPGGLRPECLAVDAAAMVVGYEAVYPTVIHAADCAAT